MKKYDQQEEILAGRNSYAKTDTEATFMRMKEDHMKNGQLKRGYSVKFGTENQFIVGFSVHQDAGDTSCMKEHLSELKKELSGKTPKNIVADAGYGSEENYEHLQELELGNYVKYNTFHKEASRKWKTYLTRVQNWHYNEDNDCHLYINRRVNELKMQARLNLTSEKGLELRSLRPVEVESVFGNIKGNFGVRRFTLRGKQKVTLEWGVHCIAHSMRKMATANL